MKINNQTHFILFSNCILVKGYSKSIIMDLQRNGYLPIPNLLFDVLSLDLKKNSVGDIKQYFNDMYNNGINSYFKYLIDEEFGFLTDEPRNFPSLTTKFLSPFSILSSVININEESKFELGAVLQQLVNQGCQLIQIRITKKMTLSYLNEELRCIIGSRVKLVEIFIKDRGIALDDIITLFGQNLRVKFIIYSSNNYLLEHQYNNIYYIKENLNLHQKEVIDPRLFISNIPFYVESKNFNIGLNRKVSIDYDGSIKNFVNHSEIFGNISNIRLKDIIVDEDFQTKWKITNDIIEKCKDCEFRYMCLSNSDILAKDSKYYKVEQCKYDPYIGKWLN